MGATKLLAQIFWLLVTDRAEILRDRLEERQRFKTLMADYFRQMQTLNN